MDDLQWRSIWAAIFGILAFFAGAVAAYEILPHFFSSHDGGEFSGIGQAVIVIFLCGPVGDFSSGFVTAEIARTKPLEHWAAVAGILAFIFCILAVAGGPVGLTLVVPLIFACGVCGALGAGLSSLISPEEFDSLPKENGRPAPPPRPTGAK